MVHTHNNTNTNIILKKKDNVFPITTLAAIDADSIMLCEIF